MRNRYLTSTGTTFHLHKKWIDLGYNFSTNLFRFAVIGILEVGNIAEFAVKRKRKSYIVVANRDEDNIIFFSLQ